MIELRGVSRTFVLGDSAVHALRAIDLRISQGEYLSVMGPSGSGKSTLLNMLGLLDRPDSGEYLLNGTATRLLSEERRARLRREQIGFVFQSYHLVPRLNARENIELPMMLGGFSSRARGTRAARTERSRAPPAEPAFRRPASARGHRTQHRDETQPAARR